MAVPAGASAIRDVEEGSIVPTDVRSTVGRALWMALPAWVVSRVLVLVALVAAHLAAGHVRPGDPAVRARLAQGLVAWDGGWYQTIAEHGYGSAGREALRFFPLFPMLGRGIGAVPGLGTAVALVVLANLATLGALAFVWLLIRDDLGDEGLARRSVWLLALAPASYATALAYADGLLLLAVVATFWAVRTDRWWWAAGFGLAAGAVRPLGLLLVVPVVAQWWLSRRQGIGPGGLVARVAAVTAPIVGAGGYLLWVASRFGNAWLPFTVQEQSGHRGRLTVPLVAMWDDLVAALHGHHLGSALHLPWVVVAVALVALTWWRLPAPYAIYATVVVAASLSSSNLDSFERYALGAFPLIVAASTLTARRSIERVVLVVSGLLMVGYATLAFLNVVVP